MDGPSAEIWTPMGLRITTDGLGLTATPRNPLIHKTIDSSARLNTGMPRPRLPTEVLELNRSFAKNPNRKRAAPPKSTHPIGNPPTDFSAAEKKCWAEIVKYVPANVLTGADRMAVEILSRLMAQFRSREPMKASDLAVLVSLLGKMGMTPCDREKVHANKTESAEENPFAEFSVN